MSKPVIAIIGYERETVKAILEQLYEIKLNETFTLMALTVDDLARIQLDQNALVVVTSRIVQTMAKPYLSLGNRVIVAKRTINYSTIREILELPQGAQVLVVSNMKEAAEDLIEVLRESGLHLDFMPYYPGAVRDESIQVALTPGDTRHVPDNILKVINIGVRFLDISTVIEILHHFKFVDFPYHRLSARYINSLLSVTSQLSDEIFTTKILRNSMERIAHNVDEAILLFAEDGNIQFINEKALRLLNLNKEQVIEKKMMNVIPKSFIEAINSIENKYDVFKDIEKITFYMRKKPIDVDGRFFGTLILFREADEIQKLEYRYRQQSKRKNFTAKYTFSDMVTSSPSIKNLMDIAKKLAKSHSTILILGETGTGKEVLAQSIHNQSQKAYYPFVGVNFSAFTETLLESELFGYEGGAFTGARKDGKSGLFEQAHKGTIFLDEIGDASLTIQQRLLRILQEKEIMRVGGEEVIHLDVRVIAATNRDLEQMIEEGSFRKDLFYRLNVLPLYLPPLRERKSDIDLLSKRFIQELCNVHQRPLPSFTDRAMKAMHDYHWPGNIRELHNVMEYVIHIANDVVDDDHLPFISGLKYINADQSPSNRFDNLIQCFSEKGFLYDMKSILESLEHTNSVGLGRHALIKELQKSGNVLTDQQFRYRQQLLKEHSLISVERGRKGSVVTQRGKDFLRALRDRHSLLK